MTNRSARCWRWAASWHRRSRRALQKFGLANIAALSEALGNPHLRIPCVHMAGTNGKGSTAAMLESILRAAGLRTGLYTSPHLERINERIRIDGEDISDEDSPRLGRGSTPRSKASWRAASSPRIRLTSNASRQWRSSCLREGGVEFAVYEVGLGGRLDSTNIVRPEVAVITSIDFDHESFLGHSIEEIAARKSRHHQGWRERWLVRWRGRKRAP